MRYCGNNPQVWMKGGTSPVSEADHAADAYLRETLLKARPDYGWLSEETADDHARLSARRTFVVDPIDGTRGFLDGLHSWCVSVAVVEDGRSLAGVLECPAKRETYWALPGEGAYLNAKRIHVRPLGESIEAQPWMGSRPCFVDSRPVIGRAPGQPGLWLDYGHAHWGLTLGPVSGRLIAEMITGAAPFCDPAPYSAERFAA